MPCHINNVAKMDALEIADDLYELLERNSPTGLSFSQAAERLDVESGRFRRAAHTLCEMGRIRVDRGGSLSGIDRILLPHWENPTRPITERQRVVLEFMRSRMDRRNLVRVSYRQLSQELIAKRVASKKSYAHDAVECLDRKGYLKIVEAGDHHRATLYKVYPNGDGPRGYSPRPKS